MSGLYGAAGGVNREIKKLYGPVNGVNREIKELWAAKDGVNRQIFNAYVCQAHNYWTDGIKEDGSIYVNDGFVGTPAAANKAYVHLHFDDPVSFTKGQGEFAIFYYIQSLFDGGHIWVMLNPDFNFDTVIVDQPIGQQYGTTIHCQSRLSGSSNDFYIGFGDPLSCNGGFIFGGKTINKVELI
jgi:hypothetical protein